MFSLIVFDLDGTLVNSRRDITDAANTLVVEHGGAPISEERIGAMVGEGAAVLVSRAFAAEGLAQPPDALARYLEIYSRRLLAHTRPYHGIPEALASLARRARLAVLTNKPLAATRQILEGLDLARFFDAADVLGGDGPLPRKPDPAGLASLIARADAAAAETAMVGDSLIDWRTARAAGTRICVARYGFGFGTFPRDHLEPEDLAVDAPTDLARALA